MEKSDVVKFFISMVLGIALIALIAFNGLLLWVAYEPRSLQRFTPILERSFSENDRDIKLDIGGAWLLWGGWQHPLEIRLTSVDVISKDGIILSSFPEITVDLDLLSLPFGDILPTSLSINRPVVNFIQDDNNALSFTGTKDTQPEDKEDDSSTLYILLDVMVNPSSTSKLRKLSRLELLNAYISISAPKGEVVAHLPSANLVLHKESREQINGVFNAVANYDNVETPINARLLYNNELERLEGNVEFSQAHINLISNIFFKDSPLSGVTSAASGELRFATNKKGEIDMLSYALTGGKGQVSTPHLADVVVVDSYTIKGTAQDKLKQFSITQADIDFSGSKFTGTAEVALTDNGLGIQAQLAINQVPTATVGTFWPPSLAPQTRGWIIDNISDGNISTASVKLDIKPGDLDKPVMPQKSVDANLTIKNTTIRYLQGHPPVRDINAAIQIDGLSLAADISTGNAFSDTKLTNGKLLIPDLNLDNPLMELSMDAESTAQDIITLLGLPKLEHAKRLNLQAEQSSGRATGNAALSFYFYAKDEEGNETPITYDIQAKLNNVSARGFMHKFDIADATGEMSINSDTIEYKGTGTVNGTMLDTAEVSYWFSERDGMDTAVKASGKVTQDALERFGYSDLPVTMEGAAAMTLEGEFGSKKEDISARLDLTPATVTVSDLGYFKPAGEAAIFSIATKANNGSTDITSISFTGDRTQLSGKGKLVNSELTQLELGNVVFGRTRLSNLTYHTAEDRQNITIKGSALDIGGRLEKSDGEFSFENFPAIHLNLDIATIYTVSGLELKDTKGALNCGKIHCSYANLSTNLQGNDITFSINSNGPKRSINLFTKDAGNMFRAFGILDSMQGGALTLTGTYDDSPTDSILNANLDIRDYTMKDAPILAKLLSLASLTGFFDTLTGKGISFNKLVAPFTLHNDVITIKEGKTYGSSIGMTMDGTITFPATTLDLEGTVVPSYSLNSMVGKVPVIGALLAGGEGEGVFAARYSIEGNDEDPQVSVNPLSMLTPGFLRNLFDAF